ncbi:MAG: FtsQ-type POTRA domain-containing protein [Clostridia bacterium]|nr:FtsQ-type POTRA domain-containing protein [Clostridia bacterium]
MRTNASQHNRQARSRKRAKARLRLFLALCAGSLVMFISILLLLPAAFGNQQDSERKPSAIGVKSITVSGNTRYDEEAIIGISGIQLGQSVLSVNKNKVSKKLEKTFHYAEDVKIHIDWSRNVTIEITEAVPMGAVYAEGNWVVVGHDGTGLESAPISTERPLRQCYIKGAGTLSAQPGEQVLDDETLTLVAEIFDALQAVGMTDISIIDIENRNDIRLSWKNQIILQLGNDSNLRFEIAAAASTLPKVLEKHGETATGVLNLSQHSDPAIESPAIFFTPSSLLED